MLRDLSACILVILSTLDIALPQTFMDKTNRNYHLVYLDISRTMERKDLTHKMVTLINEIKNNKDDFHIFLSNGYKPEIIYSQVIDNKRIEELASLLQTLNTSSPILMFDKDTILDIWDRNDIITVNKQGKIELLYESVFFHFLISSDLLKVQEVELIDRFLLVKNLTRRHIDPERIIIDLIFSRNDSEAFIERKKQLEDNNWTGYQYLFTQY